MLTPSLKFSYPYPAPIAPSEPGPDPGPCLSPNPNYNIMAVRYKVQPQARRLFKAAGGPKAFCQKYQDSFKFSSDTDCGALHLLHKARARARARTVGPCICCIRPGLGLGLGLWGLASAA